MVMRFQVSWARDNIDVVTAMVGALLGVVISCLNLIYSNAYIITIGPILIIVCLVYLIFRRRLLAPTSDPQASHRLTMILNITFWILLAGSIYSLNTEILHRPPVYFILIALAAAIIALQIVYSRGKGAIWLILLEILLISLSVRASAYFVFPTIPGSDPWAHLVYIKAYTAQGHIPETIPHQVSISYLNYPIMHLNTVTMKLITGVDCKVAMFLSNALPVLPSILLVFLVGRKVIDTRGALLAILLLSLCDFHIAKGFEITATCLGVIFFSIILYLLIKEHKRASLKLIMILVFGVLILTHTMSTFVVFVLLLSLFIGFRTYNFVYGKHPTSAGTTTFTLVALFVIAMLTYWIYAGYTEGLTFFEAIIRGLYGALTEEAGFLARPAPISAQYGWLNPILIILGFLIVLAFGILGSLSWLSQKYQHETKVSLIVTLIILFAITLSFPLFGMRNIMPYRWFLFIYPILAIVTAQGMLIIMGRVGFNRLGSIILFCMVFAVSFFMITNNISNMDSPIYAAELNQRMVYTNSEMAIATRVIKVYDGVIITDLQYGNRVLGTHMGRGNVSYNMPREETLNSGLVIWRNVMAERPVQAPRENVVLGEAFEQRLKNSHSLIYSNNSSKAFLARGK
ncbi:hypothetical protein ACFLX6_02510 [Chloroflexota bacterium]